jgi:hypothetical protein
MRSHAANELRWKISRKRLASVQTLQLDGLRQPLSKLLPFISGIGKQEKSESGSGSKSGAR